MGYSPWSPKESDTAEGLSTTTTHFTDGICFSSHDISVGQLELYPVFEKKKLRPREITKLAHDLRASSGRVRPVCLRIYALFFFFNLILLIF